MQISVIIPAFNEQRWIDSTLRAAQNARRRLGAQARSVEIVVVDNGSSDATVAQAEAANGDGSLRVLRCEQRGAARARNHGARAARGRLLVFVDADTRVPASALLRVAGHAANGYEAGIFRLAAAEGGRRARLWWFFWEHVRRLPLARAKAMPAFMFCTREVFEELGPFDERVAIGEEWPILAELYRRRKGRLIYDRELTALSSSRRMERRRLGYVRTLLKYVWAILHFSGRVDYADDIR